MNFITSLEELTPNYNVLLCDVWGVIHNGERAFAPASAALATAREKGTYVVLLTNSPRSCEGVKAQLQKLGVTQHHYDDVVTSGDATRALINTMPAAIFHIGAPNDLSIYEGTHVTLVPESKAEAVVCTGFFDDESEIPNDYRELLVRLYAQNLPFICANPDIMVERGERLVYCAGALAQEYEKLGGHVKVAGKPHAPIYDLAMQKIAHITEDKSTVLAIGDGVLTDAAGAMNNGFDFLYISSGVHAREYGTHDAPDRAKLTQWIKQHNLSIRATIPSLR